MTDIPTGNGYLTDEFVQNAPLNNGIYTLSHYLQDGMNTAVLKGVYLEEVGVPTILNTSIEADIPAAKHKIDLLIQKQAKNISFLLTQYVVWKEHIATAINPIEKGYLETLGFFQHSVEFRQTYAVEIYALDWLFEQVKETAVSIVIAGKLS